MQRSFHHHSLPKRIPLGSEKSFPGQLVQHIKAWTLICEAGRVPALEVRTDQAGFKGGWRIEPAFQASGPSASQNDQPHDPARLIDLAWNWIEYQYAPLPDLTVRAVHWLPDPRVVCGSLHLTNTAPTVREVRALLQSRPASRSGSRELIPRSLKGRMTISGEYGGSAAGFFLAEGDLGNTKPPALAVSSRLNPGEEQELRFVLAAGASLGEVADSLERALQLDWEGEIARKRVRQEGRLRVETGDPGRDLLLASSQNQAYRILHTLSQQVEDRTLQAPVLNSLQAWQLYLALYPLSAIDLKRLLRLQFSDRELPEKGSRETALDLPLKAELVWLAQSSGHPAPLWKEYLPDIKASLEKWFSPSLDQDGDGIPEIRFPAHQLPGKPYDPIPLPNGAEPGSGFLEHPGLAALLANEIDRLSELKGISGSDPLPPVWEDRKQRLIEFVRASWLTSESRFRSRESRTHTSGQGQMLASDLSDGWQTLGIELSPPSRIMACFLDPAGPGRFTDCQVILHGQDWKGNYRVEKLADPQLDWEDQRAAALSSCIYSRLDYLSITGMGPESRISLRTPTTDLRDISHLLPLWVPGSSGQEPRSPNSLANDLLGELGSAAGLRSSAHPGSQQVDLPWNILAARGLHRQGRTALAAELWTVWLRFLADAFQETGGHLAAWDGTAGKSGGRLDTIESTLPIQLLLELAGLLIKGDGTAVCDPGSPLPWEVCLDWRGTQIRVLPDQLQIKRKGEDPILLPRSERQEIQLFSSPSLNISTR